MTAREEGGCWPTPQQELLLRAALWQNAAGLDAWRQWKNQIDIERLDYGSSRLLPLLAANLKAQGVDDALMTRFKSVTRHTWYHNQMMFASAAIVLQQLHDAGIQTLITKGAALISLHYRDIGLRPMNDFDLMVPSAQAARAMELLKSHGWQPDTRGQDNEAHELIDEKYLNTVYAQPFINERKQSFDLHRHLLPQCCGEHDDDIFWQGAVATSLNGVQTRALNPSDQILHACIHGVQWNSVAPLRWIADAMIVMRTSDDIDWNRLVEHTRSRRLNLPVGAALHYLRDKMDAPIPLEIIEEIAAMPSSRFDRLEYESGLKPRESCSPVLAFWLRYRWFARLRHSQGRAPSVFAFADYLRRLWKVRSLWQLPLVAWTKTVRQARRWLRNRNVAAAKKRG